MARSVLQYNAIIVPNSKKWFSNGGYSPDGFNYKTKTLWVCVGGNLVPLIYVTHICNEAALS